MLILVPKFLQEYPILLPVDPVYHNRLLNFKKLLSNEYTRIKKVKSMNDKNESVQVYVEDEENRGYNSYGIK